MSVEHGEFASTTWWIAHSRNLTIYTPNSQHSIHVEAIAFGGPSESKKECSSTPSLLRPTVSIWRNKAWSHSYWLNRLASPMLRPSPGSPKWWTNKAWSQCHPQNKLTKNNCATSVDNATWSHCFGLFYASTFFWGPFLLDRIQWCRRVDDYQQQWGWEWSFDNQREGFFAERDLGNAAVSVWGDNQQSWFFLLIRRGSMLWRRRKKKLP